MSLGLRFYVSRKGGTGVSATAGWHFPGDLIANSLLVGVVKTMYLLRMAEINCESSFEPSNASEQILGYV